MHWVNILLPIATLIIGSVLTMLGQALSDRRREAGEERARKEQFRVGNFDIHRTAMLDMQELLRAFGDAVTAESIRRRQSGEYEYFDVFRVKPEEHRQRIAVFMDWQKETSERIRNGEITEDKREEFNAEVVRKMREVVEVAEESMSDAKESGRYIEARWPFFDELVKAAGEMRLRMQRSGSNSVVWCGEEYIQTVFKWSECLASAGVAERYDQVRKSRVRLDRALSNALTFGPYDKFDPDEGLPSLLATKDR